MPDGTVMNLPLMEDYDAVAPGLAGAGVEWLDKLRSDGLARYGKLGLPGPRDEAWKYTNLTRMGRTRFVTGLASAEPALDAVPEGVLDIDAVRVVSVNGRLRPALSNLSALPPGVSITTLGDAVRSGDQAIAQRLGQISYGHDMPMLALNTAYLHDGVIVEVAEGVSIDTPIHLISVGVADDDPVAFHPRNVISLGAGASGTFYESHVGVGSYLSNGATALHLGDDAILRHRKLQNETNSAYHVASASVELAARARYENYTLHIGGRLARNEVHVILKGREANCCLYGAYTGHGSQHIDTTTFVDHAVPDCTSREVYKGALDDSSCGVFQGKILVRKDAQRTDGHQLNKALLLSEGAEIDAKPELEIYADDVKCSHGATAGELDEEQLFYLRSRGVMEAEARDLLVTAFLEESLEVIADEERRDAFRGIIANWLSERRERQEN